MGLKLIRYNSFNCKGVEVMIYADTNAHPWEYRWMPVGALKEPERWAPTSTHASEELASKEAQRYLKGVSDPWLNELRRLCKLQQEAWAVARATHAKERIPA